MKRTVALLLVLATLFSLAGCREVTNVPSQEATADTTQATTEPKPVAADLLISEVMPDNKFLTMGHEHD